MKALVTGAVLAAVVVASPALAQYRSDTVQPNESSASLYSSHQGSGGLYSRNPRLNAIHACSDSAAKYAQPTWGSLNMSEYRTCMMEHGQAE